MVYTWVSCPLRLSCRIWADKYHLFLLSKYSTNFDSQKNARFSISKMDERLSSSKRTVDRFVKKWRGKQNLPIAYFNWRSEDEGRTVAERNFSFVWMLAIVQVVAIEGIAGKTCMDTLISQTNFLIFRRLVKRWSCSLYI